MVPVDAGVVPAVPADAALVVPVDAGVAPAVLAAPVAAVADATSAISVTRPARTCTRT